LAKATLALVAERCGYSIATISRALHNDPAVLAETREHVLRVCREVGYRPSIAGRRLSQGSKAVVGLSLGARDFVTNRFVSIMHQALTARLAQSGWSVELIPASGFDARLDVGGLILVGAGRGDPRFARAIELGIPTVAIGHEVEGFSVVPDDRLGGRLAAEHLASGGRSRFAVLHVPGPDARPVLRVAAYLERLREMGHAAEEIRAAQSATASLTGYRTMASALAAGQRFDALFCETDELALGALAALEDAGIAVPRQVAVIGFDDLPGLSARLTTIRQDFGAMAEAAIALLADARQRAEPRHLLVPVALVRRETS